MIDGEKIIPIGCQSSNRSCRVDLFLPFNCTDVAPKCDEEIVTEAAVPNSLPVVTSRHPPFFVALLGFINDTDSGTIAAAVAPHGGRLNNRLDR